VHIMKTKLTIIAVTFLATTLFWCLAIGGFFWCLPDKGGVSFIGDAQQRGFSTMMSARNTESHPVTFTVVEVGTNTASADAPQAVLLERQLPPAGELWIGVRKTKAGAK
jgi:hypothetical protein